MRGACAPQLELELNRIPLQNSIGLNGRWRLRRAALATLAVLSSSLAASAQPLRNAPALVHIEPEWLGRGGCEGRPFVLGDTFLGVYRACDGDRGHTAEVATAAMLRGLPQAHWQALEIDAASATLATSSVAAGGIVLTAAVAQANAAKLLEPLEVRSGPSGFRSEPSIPAGADLYAMPVLNELVRWCAVGEIANRPIARCFINRDRPASGLVKAMRMGDAVVQLGWQESAYLLPSSPYAGATDPTGKFMTTKAVVRIERSSRAYPFPLRLQVRVLDASAAELRLVSEISDGTHVEKLREVALARGTDGSVTTRFAGGVLKLAPSGDLWLATLPSPPQPGAVLELVMEP